MQDAICNNTVTTLKYYKRGEAFIPLSAFGGQALFIFWVYQDGWGGSDCEVNWDHCFIIAMRGKA
jgi:hypothetical protein